MIKKVKPNRPKHVYGQCQGEQSLGTRLMERAPIWGHALGLASVSGLIWQSTAITAYTSARASLTLHTLLTAAGPLALMLLLIAGLLYASGR